MRKHNRDATIISEVLGFTALALFVDGLLRLLGIIPPFMHIDIDVLDKIVDKVEDDVIDQLKKYQSKNSLNERYNCLLIFHLFLLLLQVQHLLCGSPWVLLLKTWKSM